MCGGEVDIKYNSPLSECPLLISEIAQSVCLSRALTHVALAGGAGGVASTTSTTGEGVDKSPLDAAVESRNTVHYMRGRYSKLQYNSNCISGLHTMHEKPPGFRVSNSRHAAHGTTTCMCMCMLHVTPCLHKQPRVYDPQGAESLPLWLFGQGGGGGLAVLAAVSRPGQGVHRHGGRLRRLPVLVGHAPSHCARRGRALGAEREEGAPRAGVWRPRAVVRPPSHKSTRFAHGLSCCRGGGRHPVRDGRPGARNFSG